MILMVHGVGRVFKSRVINRLNYLPVLPNPPLSFSSSFSTSATCAETNGMSIIWTIRSPRSMVTDALEKLNRGGFAGVQVVPHWLSGRLLWQRQAGVKSLDGQNKCVSRSFARCCGRYFGSGFHGVASMGFVTWICNNWLLEWSYVFIRCRHKSRVS